MSQGESHYLLVPTTMFSALLSVVLGCSDGRLPTYPVSGKVVFSSGGNAQTGTIEFKSRTHGVQARGDIQSDGSFTLSTYEPNDGAVAGKQDCVVVQLVIVEQIADFSPSLLGIVHPKHGSYSTSGLEFDVVENQENVFTVTVDPLSLPSPGRNAGTRDQQHQHKHDH